MKYFILRCYTWLSRRAACLLSGEGPSAGFVALGQAAAVGVDVARLPVLDARRVSWRNTDGPRAHSVAAAVAVLCACLAEPAARLGVDAQRLGAADKRRAAGAHGSLGARLADARAAHGVGTGHIDDDRQGGEHQQHGHGSDSQPAPDVGEKGHGDEVAVNLFAASGRPQFLWRRYAGLRLGWARSLYSQNLKPILPPMSCFYTRAYELIHYHAGVFRDDR